MLLINFNIIFEPFHNGSKMDQNRTISRWLRSHSWTSNQILPPLKTATFLKKYLIPWIYRRSWPFLDWPAEADGHCLPWFGLQPPPLWLPQVGRQGRLCPWPRDGQGQLVRGRLRPRVCRSQHGGQCWLQELYHHKYLLPYCQGVLLWNHLHPRW